MKFDTNLAFFKPTAAGLVGRLTRSPSAGRRGMAVDKASFFIAANLLVIGRSFSIFYIKSNI